MLLNVSGVSKSFGSTQLLSNISFEIGEHDKVGLVGVNGAGKTTLFKMLTGEQSCDDGQISASRELRMGYLRQHILPCNGRNVFEETLQVFDHLIRLEQQIEDVRLDIELKNGDVSALAEKQHSLSAQYEDRGGFVYKSRTRAMLLGLGFAEEDLKKPAGVLSGGENTRLQLAKLLLSDTNLLLLDEPTNHLDIAAMEWLENYLISYSGAVVVISHDRYFLDRIANQIFEIENGSLSAFSGNYSDFIMKKEDKISAMEKKYDNTMREIKRIEGIIEQQKRWNRERNIKTAESKQKMIDRLEKTLEAPPEQQEEIKFAFTARQTGGNDVLTAEDLSMGFDGGALFRHVNLHIRRGERVFLLGPNGCGKTTLFKTLLGEYTSKTGDVRLGSNIFVGYYDQHQDDLNENKTMMDEIWDCYPDKTQTQIRNACAAFLFKGDDVFKPVGVMSGGEKARVSLLKLMLSGSNFLMLDEPTNHLDIASKEALENAFAGYDGAMLIISHDRYFINKLAHRIFRLTPEGIRVFEGNYDFYTERMKEETAPVKKEQKPNDYRQKKEQTARLRKLQNHLARTEDEIAASEEEIARLHDALCDPENSADYGKVLELTQALESQKQNLEQQMADWESQSLSLDELLLAMEGTT